MSETKLDNTVDNSEVAVDGYNIVWNDIERVEALPVISETIFVSI